MAKKRKSDATRLDEVDRTLYTTFSSAANSLSHLYSQAMHHQKLSFQAGERHSLEKLYNWIVRQHEDGARAGTNDILAYIQNELDQWTDEPPPSPRLPFQQQQQSQPATPMMPSGFPVSSNLYGPANTRNVNFDNQPRNAVFSNALSSPIRRNLQHYHLAQGGHSINHVMRNNENNVSQSRDPNLPSSNDTSMDMHADSPDHDSHC
ncbi:uncharacterized protein LOC111390382 isoform X2 [Olea europaea var. sylvestris]|uniref:Uncharacterized protein LOC111390382 isoform X1 n=1 Tax=Olea europaea subsp. europaea TaxID=158383 RepID=A0A8S0URK8_OLEEU|nr:uncharacterized protein LOC111390382 isoform X1 [Olea europaea var. sylvestris]XP_022871188.1 uncharacterized protein LOC111390382 isoform X2 [Olea europaea var. sylvestris]CAA3020517.1 uncharacterized protein LOC111390382 isoform X1 [Olea europaea subsp. europaea]